MATFVLLLNGLVLDTMVCQGINTTSPVLDYRGDLHPVAERPGAGHDGPPGQVPGAGRPTSGGAGANGRSHRGLHHLQVRPFALR